MRCGKMAVARSWKKRRDVVVSVVVVFGLIKDRFWVSVVDNVTGSSSLQFC